MPDNHKAANEILNSVALLVIDAQDVFIDTIHNREEFLMRTAFVIEAARTLRIKTIFTEQVPNRLGRTNSRLYSLARKPKVFSKNSFSALKSNGIEQYLKNQEVYNLIVCGLETPICIYQTVLNAEEIDIDCTVLTDALGCRREKDGEQVLEAMRKLNCELLPSESVFYSLLSDTIHPLFKQFNNLVSNYAKREFDENYFKGSSNQNSQNIEKSKHRNEKPFSRKNRFDSQNSENNKKVDAAPEEPSKEKPVSSTPTKAVDSPNTPDSNRKAEVKQSELSLPTKEHKSESAAEADSLTKEPAKKKAKKAAKRIAKKAAKKITKKTTKKATKRVAKKTAAKSSEKPTQASEENLPQTD
ncbi:isochorismatase family protein [Puniceicoccaceae bacterium K14]|nr:isochorismatase family protein [Puniceicoccaceae bacterium K14]